MDDNNDKTVIVERDADARSTSSGPIMAIVALVVLIVLAIIAYNLLLAPNDSTTETTVSNDVVAPVQEGVDATNPVNPAE
ncbi:hypothetical protein B7Y94_05370 [Candidatus Saccharibacteria bacterium 32-49-12]|nr:MAG: hypothetical protein B7Y94_05370 [Candidatus Saccharibacteria bacterium 32-49-12]